MGYYDDTSFLPLALCKTGDHCTFSMIPCFHGKSSFNLIQTGSFTPKLTVWFDGWTALSVLINVPIRHNLDESYPA